MYIRFIGVHRQHDQVLVGVVDCLPTMSLGCARGVRITTYCALRRHPCQKADHSTRWPAKCGSNRLNLPLSMAWINTAPSQTQTRTNASAGTRMRASAPQKTCKQTWLWRSSDQSWNCAEMQRPVDIKFYVLEPTLRPLVERNGYLE